MIPNAVADLEKLVAASVGLVEAIPFAADLDPPEVIVLVVILKRKIGVTLVGVRPLRRNKLDLVIGLADLKKTAHSHRLLIGNVGGNRLVKVRLRLTTVHIMRSREICQNGVTRAIGKIGR